MVGLLLGARLVGGLGSLPGEKGREGERGFHQGDEAGFGGNVGNYFGWWWAVAGSCGEASRESLWGRHGRPLSEEGWAIASKGRPGRSRSCLDDEAVPCLRYTSLGGEDDAVRDSSGEIGAEGGEW